jgi:hypothetical protein
MELDSVCLGEKGGNAKCVSMADLTYPEILSGALSTQMSHHTALDQPITGAYLLCLRSLLIYGSIAKLWTIWRRQELAFRAYSASAIITLHEEVSEFTTLLKIFTVVRGKEEKVLEIWR